ncbi:hypothetical protein [Streptomyces sp. NPDC051776]|uniref:hypothetical protein n=1 Tax=Streptomyces sp. NPDC051776 TaxID=3155414 RepID=UPI003425134D
MSQQNVAQEDRQNNFCSSGNDDSGISLNGGRVDERCWNKDASFNKGTLVKGGGARAEGGSSTGGSLRQQNLAQEGRQNNNCASPNDATGIALTGGRVDESCWNKDGSFSKHTVVKGGGARAEGGSSTQHVGQQNAAQEGRQNNFCSSGNDDADFTVSGGRVEARCKNKDVSFNHKAFVKGGGARVEGGSSTGGSVHQQNVAQEGRQNNNCNNPNGGNFTVTGSRYEVRCKTEDGSANVRTADFGGGARATGGSGTLEVLQQNTAQEGRQNNSCGNPNNLPLTATGSRTQAHCVAADRSTNIGTVNR